MNMARPALESRGLKSGWIKEFLGVESGRGLCLCSMHIRAIEMKLITENKMNRLLDMVNPEDAIKFLAESGYGAELPDSYKSLTGAEKLFDAEQRRLIIFD